MQQLKQKFDLLLCLVSPGWNLSRLLWCERSGPGKAPAAAEHQDRPALRARIRWDLGRKWNKRWVQNSEQHTEIEGLMGESHVHAIVTTYLSLMDRKDVIFR